jgi:hypothetical protein
MWPGAVTVVEYEVEQSGVLLHPVGVAEVRLDADAREYEIGSNHAGR